MHTCAHNFETVLGRTSLFGCGQRGESARSENPRDQGLWVVGRGRGRPFFLLRLRANADLSLAFWPGGIKNACLFASLIISSVMTLRLKRRNALSIDSPGLIVTTAIYFSKIHLEVSMLPRNESLFNMALSVGVKSARKTPRTVQIHPRGFR